MAHESGYILSRTLTPKGLVYLMAELAKRKVQFQSLTDQIDTSTPAGRFRDGASDVAPFILVGKRDYDIMSSIDKLHTRDLIQLLFL